jgi:hypothetical protein
VLFAGAGKSGSAKAPAATAIWPGLRAGSQYRLVPHSGQKWNVTGNPVSEGRVKLLDAPETLTACTS